VCYRFPSIVIAVSVLTVGPGSSDSFAAGLQNSAWPMFQQNAEHSGRSQASISLEPQILWSAALADSAEFSSPAIDVDGNVYIGDVGDQLHKFAPDGTPIWSYDTVGNVRRSSPAISEDGTVYIGSADGTLHAVNPDGTARWTYLAGGGIKTSPAVDSNGAIYFGADDGLLYSLTELGALRWTYTAPDTIRSSPAIATDSLVVFGSNDGGVTALLTDGTFRWNGVTGGPVKAGISIGQGDDIFIPSQDGFLYALRNHGAFNWAHFTGRTLRGTPAVGVTGAVYITVDNEVWCVDDEGLQVWVAATPGAILGSPVVHTDATTSDETVIVGSEDGFVYGVADGAILWSVEIGAPIRSSAAIGANGTIYVGANDGRLHALGDAPTTSVSDLDLVPGLMVRPNPAPSGATIEFRSSHDLNGQLTILDPSGREVGAIPMRQGTASWSGQVDDRAAPAGVYFYKWSVGNESGHGRVVVLR